MTAGGAPTHAVMLAGRWQGAGMVARYTRALTAARRGPLPLTAPDGIRRAPRSSHSCPYLKTPM